MTHLPVTTIKGSEVKSGLLVHRVWNESPYKILVASSAQISTSAVYFFASRDGFRGCVRFIPFFVAHVHPCSAWATGEQCFRPVHAHGLGP